MKDSQTYREDEGNPKKRLSNAQADQPAMDESPAEGGGGFVGSNTGPALGLNIVEGKKGSVSSRSIWDEQSSFSDENANTGSGDVSFGGQDSTDEKASYKKVQTDEGLPQTYRRAAGAGDAGPTDSDETEGRGIGEVNLNTESHPSPDSGDASFSDMPQTEFTHNEGGGAPRFKR